MPAKKADIKWSDVKKQLHKRGMPDLLDLVHELFKLSVENRAFLAARLLGGAAVQPLIKTYRQRIEQAFYKRSGFPQEKLRLGDARKAIRDFQAATSDLAGTLELMLTYVETGTQFTRSFGDIDEPFYHSLSSVLSEIKQLLVKKDGRCLYGQYRERLLELRELAEPIGWGYGDEVGDVITKLEDRYAGASGCDLPAQGAP